MRPFFYICFLFLFYANTSAQENRDFAEIYKNAKTILFTQPQEAVKITAHLIQNSENTHQLSQSHLLKAAAHNLMGEYDKEVKAILEAKKNAEKTNDIETQIKTSIVAIFLLNYLGMDVVAEEYYLQTKALENETKNKTITLYLEGGNAIITAYKQIEENNPPQALNNLKNALSNFEKIPNETLKNETIAVIIETYLQATDIDLAEKYFQSTLQNTDGNHPNNFIKMVTLNQLGNLYFLKKEYQNSLSSYQTALEISKQINNKPYTSKILGGLSTTYLALDEASYFYSNRTESDKLANDVEKEEENAVNSIYNYINDNNVLKKSNVKNAHQRNILILVGILALILLTWAIMRFRYRYRAKQYQNFINYFENKQKPKEPIIIKEIPKSLNIPKETELALTQKLSQFENSKQFTKQDMSLAMLASHFDTNTKYLSEIINTHKGKNFNSYINELRINYITDRLKNNRTYLHYKISYLAEESGFSSHSSFATVFKAVTGISPTVFIEMLKTSKKTARPIYEEVE